jgi:hypothetical protein
VTGQEGIEKQQLSVFEDAVVQKVGSFFLSALIVFVKQRKKSLEEEDISVTLICVSHLSLFLDF